MINLNLIKERRHEIEAKILDLFSAGINLDTNEIINVNFRLI